MAYSFIGLPEKTPFVRSVKRIWVGFGILLVGLSAALLFLRAANAERAETYRMLLRDQDALAVQIGQLESHQKVLSHTRASYEHIQTSNQLVIEKVRNILDLVPDSATLQRFELYDDGLVIAGETFEPERLQKKVVNALLEFYRLEERKMKSGSNGQTFFILSFAEGEGTQ